MISRLTATAAAFAVVATTALGLVAESAHSAPARVAARATAAAAAEPLPQFALPRVEIVGKRTATR